MTTNAHVVADYERWLHRVANDIGRPEDHDDLVQEGRIAMWRALESYDETLGSLPSWLTEAARMRMKDLAWKHGQPLGRPATRGSREVESGTSLDAYDEDVVEALLGHVETAYHDGEVLDAIRELTPAQQQYVFLRFWGGLDPRSRAPEIRALVAEFPVLQQRHHWQRAKKILADRLGHLSEGAA